MTRADKREGVVTFRAGRSVLQTPCRSVRVAAELDDEELQRLLTVAMSRGGAFPTLVGVTRAEVVASDSTTDGMA